MTSPPPAALLLGEHALSTKIYHEVAAGGVSVELSGLARSRMEEHRASLRRQLESGVTMYGVNTGYGADSRNALAAQDIRAVQRNTLTSHAVGTGGLLSRELVRGMLLLKANVLALGPSAVRPCVVELLLHLLNRDIVPVIPEQGSLSASGDLVPQGHLGQALIGEGEVWSQGVRRSAAQAFADEGLTPLQPEEKEGLALVNGTAFTTAYALENVRGAERLLQTADVVAALTMQALRGFDSSCDARVVAVRPHAGAALVARNVRALVSGSTLLEGLKSRVHDPYCLRCLPQIHGASRDAFAYIAGAVEVELNSNTDNPLIFPEHDEWISGGNFHAQPLGIPMDTLAVAMSEIASVSQRRTQHLVSPVYQVGLPDKLSTHADRSIGLFMLNTTAAALVMENKTLCLPASIDSIAVDTTEDHVSMASVAARKARQIISNTANVLALELVCACQALDIHGVTRASPPAAAVHALVRELVAFVDEDRSLYRDVAVVAEHILAGDVSVEAASCLDAGLA